MPPEPKEAQARPMGPIKNFRDHVAVVALTELMRSQYAALRRPGNTAVVIAWAEMAHWAYGVADAMEVERRRRSMGRFKGPAPRAAPPPVPRRPNVAQPVQAPGQHPLEAAE